MAVSSMEAYNLEFMVRVCLTRCIETTESPGDENMLHILYGVHQNHDSHTRRRTAPDCYPFQDENASHSYLIHIVVIHKVISSLSLLKLWPCYPRVLYRSSHVFVGLS